MKEIAILINEHSLASSVTGAQDLFNIANRVWRYIEGENAQPLFRVRLVSIDGERIKTATGIIIQPDLKISALLHCDFLLIAAFNYERESDLLFMVKKQVNIAEQLRRLHEQGVPVGASCSATFMLAASGILDGGRATTGWWLANNFRKNFPKIQLVLSELIIEENMIWTAGATTSYLSLCLKIIEILVGQQIANQVSKVLLIDTNRMCQIPFMSLPSQTNHQDKVIAKCQDWIQSNLANSVTLEDMAELSAMSKRNFIRRFKKAVGETPAVYLQRLRIEAAKRYLESTNWSLESIIEKVGYEDLSAFRRVFQKLTTLSPASYRHKFSLSA